MKLWNVLSICIFCIDIYLSKMKHHHVEILCSISSLVTLISVKTLDPLSFMSCAHHHVGKAGPFFQ